MKPSRVLALGLAGLAIAALVAGVYLLGSGPVPATTAYRFDLDAMRRLARSGAGALPIRIRYETIAQGSLPRGLIMAGEGLDPVEMPRAVFEVVYPDQRFVLIDSAYDRSLHETGFGGQPFFDEAWNRLVVAMENAAAIVITHEHSDHLGGVAMHPRPERLVRSLRVNPEQIENPRAVDAALPTRLQEAVEPVRYDDLFAVAPGIVLKRAAGHTPGSQMIFVVLESGQELLFVGDVVWNRDMITELKYRPRFVTDVFLGEDRAAVLDQIRALRNLMDESEISIVVSHDARTFATAGLAEGFSPSAYQRVGR